MITDGQLHLSTPYLELDEEFYDQTPPIPLKEPYLIHFSQDAAKLLDLDVNSLDEQQLIALLNAQELPQGGAFFSMCYAGHQFGHYNPRLGDGRAHHLGKYKQWNLQLKGSGDTLYARMADGRAVIRSSIREYLMSEAMHHLGIPTTRALGVIGSKTRVARNTMEYAANTMRLSTSWIRFGSFEYFYYTKSYDKLEQLAQYVIQESYPHLRDDEDRFYKMFCEVVERTAKLIAQWQGVGFCHGVMNTDNMSIEGLSIDYGPFAMLDDYNFSYVCNHTDKAGRYSYGAQPNIAYWNLTQLAKALSPLIDTARMQQKLDDYGQSIYPDAFMEVMRQKLGLALEFEDDVELVKELVGAMQDAQVDNTLFYRTLSRYDGDRSPVYDICMDPVIIDAWLSLYDARLSKETLTLKTRHQRMLSVNPKYVLKNHMLQKAIEDAQKGDFSMIDTLLHIARHPYDELPQYEHFAQDTPEAFKNLGLSCSS